MKLLYIIFEGVVDLNELKKLTKNEFIQQATKKWKGKYTYDNVNYVNQKLVLQDHYGLEKYLIKNMSMT